MNEVASGAIPLATDLTEAEKRKMVFAFVSSETKQTIAAQMKQLTTNMDNLERKHYEKRMSKLEEQIELA